MDFFEVVHTQRSIRSFKPDPVPDEAIWMMIDAAIRAPSGGNTQPWAWLVVRDGAKKKVIADGVRAFFDQGDRLRPMRERLERETDPVLQALGAGGGRVLRPRRPRAGADHPLPRQPDVAGERHQ